MEDKLTDYEQQKWTIRRDKERRGFLRDQSDEFDSDLFENPVREVTLTDVVQVGSKILIGGGLGVLAGVAGIAVVASAAEVVIGGVITKVAGVVGCAAGLSLGLNKFKARRKKAYEGDY